MNDSVTASALAQARATGRPVAIPGVQGLFAYPTGNIGPPQGGGFGRGNALVSPQPTVATASPSWWSSLTQPNSGPDLGLNVGTPTQATAAPTTLPDLTVTASRLPPVLNQANPNVQTYAGQPTLGGGNIAAAPGTPSGPAMAPPGQPMPQQSQPSQSQRLAAQAAAYRAAAAQSQGGGQGGGMTADQLNALSLAAAQAGRTYWNPAMNVQPGGNVVNALTTPPNANQMVAAS